MISLEQAVSNLCQRRANLASVDPFFRSYSQGWYRQAALALRTSGRSLRPDSAEPEEWETFLDELSRYLNLYFVMADADGEGVDIELRIGVGDKGFVREPITYQQILQWVQAGEEDDPLGKYLDERDDGYDAYKIATRVQHALKRGAMTGNSIRDFLEAHTNTGPDGSNLLDALILLWRDQLGPIVVGDWRRWVHEQVTVG